ncbi:MAG: hypothetical protein JXN62_14210 [Bacteroidales bacterium]|nr:hypothetical protein [Bacteroidales bacterium]
MQKLTIKEIKIESPVNFDSAEQLLEQHTVSNPVQRLNWEEFNYLPEVNFRIGHSGNEIWLKYYVKEKHIRALETRSNGDVYKDSCVEFFLSFDGINYYNFEFNCIGTIHLGWGPGRHNRKFVDPSIINKIKVRSSLGNNVLEERSGKFKWEIMLQIPLECLAFTSLYTLKGLEAKGNFYKCGDETPEPHFVTWNPVKTEKPDYHRPEYFGDIYFE